MIEFKVVGIGELDRRRKGVNIFRSELEDRRNLLKEVNDYLEVEWLNNFADKGARYEKWKPLAKATQEDRRSKGYNPTDTLIRDSDLNAAFAEQSSSGRINAASVRWKFSDTGESFPVSHHLGFENPNKGRGRYKSKAKGRKGRLKSSSASAIPARMLWDIDDQNENEIASMVEDFLTRLAIKHFA
jgi:phage gpG-like protein